VRPRTTMYMLEGRTWKLLPAQLSFSLPYIPTSHSELLSQFSCLPVKNLIHLQQKSAKRCFWHEKASRPPLPQSQLLPTLWPTWFFSAQAALINYSLYHFQAAHTSVRIK